jgi:integrase
MSKQGSSTVKLSTRFLETRTPPDEGMDWLTDSSTRTVGKKTLLRRGLRLAHSAHGTMTWYARINGSKKKLGQYPKLDVANARAFFDEVKEAGSGWQQHITLHQQEWLPAYDPDTAPPPPTLPESEDTRYWLKKFCTVQIDAGIKTALEQRNSIENHIMSHRYEGKELGDMTPYEWRSYHMAAAVSVVSEKGDLRAAQNARKHGNTFWNWMSGTMKKRKEVLRGRRVPTTVRQPQLDGLPVNPFQTVEPPSYKARRYVIPVGELQTFWQKIKASPLRPQVQEILRLQFETFSRSGEVAGIEWGEINLRQRTWTMPPERTKNDQEHTVYLPTQAVARLKAIKAEQKKSGMVSDYVFPRPRPNDRTDKPMDSKDVAKAINNQRKWKLNKHTQHRVVPTRSTRKLDVHINFTAHSLRHSSYTWATDVLGVPEEVCEALINHKKNDTVMRKRYNCVTYKDKRTEIVQALADQVEGWLA